MTDTVLMSAADIGKSLRRVSHELVEAHPDTSHLLLIGIRTRGLPLAQRIARNICLQRQWPNPCRCPGHETLPRRPDTPPLSLPMAIGSAIPGGVTGRDVVLVDDVLFTGRTIRAALDALVNLGRPRSVQLFVLVDRGHRELPIRADYVGKNIPTSLAQTVKVRLEEMDGRDEVVLLGNAVSIQGRDRVTGGVKLT